MAREQNELDEQIREIEEIKRRVSALWGSLRTSRNRLRGEVPAGGAEVPKNRPNLVVIKGGKDGE